MSIGGVSLWQQDQNYWSQAQAESQASSAQNSLIGVIGDAMVNQAKGLASIANGTALKRVNSELVAAVQAALQPSGSSTSSSTGSSAASSSSSGSSGSSSSKSTAGAPAVATGTAPLSTNTSLASLGILSGGKITVTTGLTTTTYRSTGTDTVGDLIDALNVNLSTNAQVTASLNSRGQLVITGRNDTAFITIGGTGTDASAIGFGVGHTTFKPTPPSASPASTASSSSASSSSTGSASNKTSSSSTASKTTTSTDGTSLAMQSISTAASLLSASGVSGSLVDMLT